MEIYPLSILPGTRLKDEAESWNLDYMSRPPYHVVSTPAMPPDEIRLAISTAEDRLGIEFFPPVIPRFTNPFPPLIHYLDLRREAKPTLDQLQSHPERVGHSLTIMWKGRVNHPDLRSLTSWLEETNPTTLVQLILDRPDIPSKKEIAALSAMWRRDESYFDRIHRFKIHPQARHAVRLFHLVDDPAMIERYLWQSQYCDLIARYTPDLLAFGEEILEEKPLLLVDTPIPEDQKRLLDDYYQGFENFIVTPH